MTCVIVEDEPLARNLLEKYVAKVPHLELLRSFADPLEALSFLRDSPVDILFSDIQMPELTGISLLKILPPRPTGLAGLSKPIIILTTAYSEYAIEGYELDVTDYLLKPITFDRFLKSVEKAGQRLVSVSLNDRESSPITPFVEQNRNAPLDAVVERSRNVIFVKDGSKLVKIRLADIQYIEGLKDYVSIFTPEKKVVTLQTMKNLEAQLPENQFIRIHNSYIVNFDWVDVIHREQVQIGKTMLPVSDTYRKAFREFVERRQGL